MKFSYLGRKLHAWVSIVIALPIVVIVVTGILLQFRKELPFVQPPEQRGSAAAPSIPFDRILAICQAIPEAGVHAWSDIERLDLRPARGVIKVVPTSRHEIQIDAATGAVLQVAYRRSDWIETMHDGTWFHRLVRSWVFVPAAFGLFFLVVSGVYLFLLPFMTRRRRARLARVEAA